MMQPISVCIISNRKPKNNTVDGPFQVIIGLQIFGSSTFSISMYDNEVYEYPAMALVIGKGGTAGLRLGCVDNYFILTPAMK